MTETKSEIRARIEELKQLRAELVADAPDNLHELQVSIPDAARIFAEEIDRKIQVLREQLEKADGTNVKDRLIELVLTSHKTMCDVKQMGEKEAFGHDPAIYYGLALSGECGELANKLIKVLRTSNTFRDKQKAIISEIADIIIYTIILAYTNDIDLFQEVEKKVEIVIKRARSGYYGGPLNGETVK